MQQKKLLAQPLQTVKHISVQNLKTTHFVFAWLPAIDTLTNWNSSLGKKGRCAKMERGVTTILRSISPETTIANEQKCAKKCANPKVSSNVQENFPTSPS